MRDYDKDCHVNDTANIGKWWKYTDGVWWLKTNPDVCNTSCLTQWSDRK